MPKIYVASLADYNSGYLHGVWIALDECTDLDNVTEQVATMLKESPAVARGLSCLAEEYAIHDYEDFEGYQVQEHTPLSEVVEIAAAIAEHGEPFAKFLNDHGHESVEESVENFTDRLCGTWDSAGDFAWDDFESCSPEAYATATLCDWVRFDPEAYVRAHEMDGYEFIETASGVTVLTPDR